MQSMLTRYPQILVIVVSTLAGALVYAYLQNWIIITYPAAQQSTLHMMQENLAGIKRKIHYTYWHHNKWCTEQQELMCPANRSEHIFYIINTWLTMLYEEHVLDKKIHLQAVLLSGSGNEIYLSFDSNPLSDQQTTYDQWMWVESLLKTLRDNVQALHTVQFLVNHQPLNTTRLDFTNPWPIMGFLKR
jgi:hypothetical protein